MKQMPKKGTVRVGILAYLPEVLRSLEADTEQIFDEANFNMALLADPDNVISYAARGHLLHVCASVTRCDHIGLLLGQKGNLSSFGLIGHLARLSSTLGTALETLKRYFHLHVQGARLKLNVEGNLACFGYQVYEPDVEATMQVEDGAMAWGYNILKEVCGDEFELSSVFFLHRPPHEKAPYEEFFRAPLSFDSAHEGLYFKADFLDMPLNQQNPDLERLLQKEVNRVQANYHDSFLDHFRRVMHSVMWVRPASAEEIAALFSMSSRTLKRRLKEQGTSYREIADSVKCQIACEVLQDSRMNLNELAELLHYHDASSFIKAFRRWKGMTPAEWRIRNAQ